MMEEFMLEWNPWWNKSYSFDGITRENLKNILPWIKRKEIVSIVGVRRAGKTTLLFEIVEHLIKKEKINPKNIFFIKADDDRIKKEKLIDDAIEKYKTLINPIGKIYLFIDEIQEIDEWQKAVKRIYDLRNDFKIFISGSNTSIIKEELSSLLAGRYATFEIFPFTFHEFLNAKGLNIKDNFTILQEKNAIKSFLKEYIQYGAFPEVALEKNENIRKELIGYYFDSIFYRDIIKRKNIRTPAKLENLIKYFLQNISNLANFTMTGKIFELSTDSVVEYTKALDDAYLIFSINLFDYSYKKQIINPKKIYCVDTGIRNIIGFKFSEDIGRLYENIVFLKLRRKLREIYYWTNKYECDFITKDGNKLEAIQVCYDIEKSKERELNGLLDALINFKLNEGTIITENYEIEEKVDGKLIKFIPLWKWLLKIE